MVLADAQQVQQVLLNLIQNAMRACSPGGTVRVGLRPASFRLPPDGPARPSAAIVVEDNGPGISAVHRARIFEPFFSAWPDGEGPGGTGLGLSVVRSIVLAHGGLVEVDAGSKGVGTRFTVHFLTTAKGETP